MTSRDTDILTNQDRLPDYVGLDVSSLRAAPQEFQLLHFSGTIFQKALAWPHNVYIYISSVNCMAD